MGEASEQHQVAKEFDVSNLNGLSKSEAIAIQRKTGWSPEVIKQLHSGKEIKIYEEANLELMKDGKAPINQK